MIRRNDVHETKVEVAKRQSDYLRGTIDETLASEATHFAHDDTQVLKFHGIYQQDNRDTRQALRRGGEETAYSFMVRCAIPGGVLTADQYLELDALADQHAGGSLRLTTRQGIQFHGIVQGDLKTTIARINDTLLTTLSACGDVERNVMACPAPLADESHRIIRDVARDIAVQLRPATRAYHEIWLDGEKQVTTKQEEPFYGAQYLPRKFKTGVALAGDNCIDLYSYDLGLIGLVENEQLIGFNVVVGGGMGMTHNKPDTFARLAQPLGFIDAADAVATAQTAVAIFRDFGNREDRRHARLKYLLAERGLDWFRGEFTRRALFTLLDWRAMPEPTVHDHLGRHPQAGGGYFYGVFVESGRVRDHETTRIKTGLKAVIEKFRPGLALTADQNLLLTSLSATDVDEIEAILLDHGVTPAARLSAARRFSMACPALPTCGLAMADAERAIPSVVGRLEVELARLGLADEPITIRMTGCPNGCARPYTADIALVGRRPDVYQVYVGGGIPGNRVVDLFANDIHSDNLIEVLRPLLEGWAADRLADESFGDYYQRVLGRAVPRQSVSGKEEPTAELIQLSLDLKTIVKRATDRCNGHEKNGKSRNGKHDPSNEKSRQAAHGRKATTDGSRISRKEKT